MQISLGLRWGNALMQDAVKKHKRGYTHVGGTMNKHTPTFECLHHSTERSKILWGGSFEIDWDMDKRHAKAGNNTSLVRKRIVRGREGEIDYRIKTSVANSSKLTLGGLASSAKSVADDAKTVNLRQRGR